MPRLFIYYLFQVTDRQALHPYKWVIPALSTTTTSFLSTRFHTFSDRAPVLKGSFLYISKSHYTDLLATPSQNFASRLTELKKKKTSRSYGWAAGEPRSLLPEHAGADPQMISPSLPDDAFTH